MKSSRENKILRGIFHVVSRFSLIFMLYRINLDYCLDSACVKKKFRVGYRVLFRSVRSILFRSFKERSVLFRFFFEFLATYETQKNVPFFSVLFFCIERKRTQRTQHSFVKNVKELENVGFFFILNTYKI